jgi:hypothetical protein
VTPAEALAVYKQARERTAELRTQLRDAERAEEAARVAHNEARHAADLLLPRVALVYPPNWTRLTQHRTHAVIVKRTPKTITVRLLGTEAERAYRLRDGKWYAAARDDSSWLEGVPE